MMGKFTKKLDEVYKFWCEMACPPESKEEFTGNAIFDFTTYDGDIDVLFCNKMLEVIECILNDETFEYQDKSNDNYINYLLMVNMPFLDGKLEYGTSIRGAWFIIDKRYEIDCGRIVIEYGELKIFIKELIKWVKV